MIFIDFHCSLHEAQSQAFLRDLKEPISLPKNSRAFASWYYALLLSLRCGVYNAVSTLISTSFYEIAKASTC